MNNKPSKMFFTYVKDENGNLQINKVYNYIEGEGVTEEDFDATKHLDEISEFFRENGVEGSDLISEAEKKGIFGRFDENELNKEKLNEFLGIENDESLGEEEKTEGTVVVPPVDPNALDDDDEYTQDEEVKADHHVAKRVAAGVLAAGAIGGALFLAHSCSQEEIVEEKNEQDLDDLYKNMTDEQRAFFEPTFKAVEEFNKRTTEDGNFKLEADNSTLHITVDEAIALNIILNDYSADELYSIFGTLEFDTNNLMNLARSSYSKLSTYYMNATKASGLSSLINDEAARAFFEKHENDVIEFNKNPNTELSDGVIKGLYYDYVYGGSTGEYAKINNDGVAWFATSAGFGFELANRNVEEFLRINNVSEEEIAKYQEAAAEVGMSLNQITTSELLNGINEEIDLDVIDEINNKSLCAAVTAETRDKVDALRMKQQIATTIIATNAKEALVNGLKEKGYNSLANKVIASDVNLSAELLDEIRGFNVNASQLVEDYNGMMNSINDKEAKLMAVLEIAREKYDLKTEIDLPDLVNNRFRTLQKENENVNENEIKIEPGEDGIPVVEGEQFNELTPEEKDDFVKDNGVVVNETTTTTEEQVSKEDLTPTEQQQVVSQENILKEVEDVKNRLITYGVEDAVNYTDEVGAYKYSKDIVIPFNNEKVDTANMSLFNIAAYASAFGDGANDINSNDAQVQNRLNNDVARVTVELDSLSSEAQQYLQNQYGSDWRNQFINESYKYGFTTQVDGSLKEARAMGAELRKTAEEEYNKAQAIVDEQNKKMESEVVVTEPSVDENINVPTTTPSVDENKDVPVRPVEDQTSQDVSDPNLDPNYGQEDEIPYVPTSDALELKEPLYYLSDAEWEAAYGAPVTEEAPAKAK